jgi:hypothetical protein
LQLVSLPGEYICQQQIDFGVSTQRNHIVFSGVQSTNQGLGQVNILVKFNPPDINNQLAGVRNFGCGNSVEQG